MCLYMSAFVVDCLLPESPKTTPGWKIIQWALFWKRFHRSVHVRLVRIEVRPACTQFSAWMLFGKPWYSGFRALPNIVTWSCVSCVCHCVTAKSWFYWTVSRHVWTHSTIEIRAWDSQAYCSSIYNVSMSSILVSVGKRLWPDPPRALDTVADGLRTQQLGQLTWPIAKDLVEQTVLSVVWLLELG